MITQNHLPDKRILIPNNQNFFFFTSKSLELQDNGKKLHGTKSTHKAWKSNSTVINTELTSMQPNNQSFNCNDLSTNAEVPTKSDPSCDYYEAKRDHHLLISKHQPVLRKNSQTMRIQNLEHKFKTHHNLNLFMKISSLPYHHLVICQASTRFVFKSNSQKSLFGILKFSL